MPVVQSMTGYGQAARRIGRGTAAIEIKSVNHRYGEVMVRLPREWMHLEDVLKKRVHQRIQRGRVDLFVTYERDPEYDRELKIQWPLIEAYWRAAEEVSRRLPDIGSLRMSDLLALPGAFDHNDDFTEDMETVKEQLLRCTDEALDQLCRMRSGEGAYLRADLMERLSQLERDYREMCEIAPSVVEQHRDKLRGRIEELITPDRFDEQRFAMEVALFAERSNIDEELTRLGSHFRQFQEGLDSDEPIGRRFDFLVQEMNREINTIGSKANHLQLTQYVVKIKAELEKMREQAQNIE